MADEQWGPLSQELQQLGDDPALSALKSQLEKLYQASTANSKPVPVEQMSLVVDVLKQMRTAIAAGAAPEAVLKEGTSKFVQPNWTPHQVNQADRIFQIYISGQGLDAVDQPRISSNPGEPQIWNISHRPNPNFVGRQDLLDTLHGLLNSGKPASTAQAIWGLGGMGKTQLAVEYAYQHSGDYSVVWWVRAEEQSMLSSDLGGLARELGLTSLGLEEGGTHDQTIVVEAVRRWLEANRGWLLIFDNAGSRDEVVDVLPRAGVGHVLITSRSPVWTGTAQPFTLPELRPDMGVEFLLRRTGQTDAESARALTDALGELPLALEHAGAYMEATGAQLHDYVELFKSARLRLWERTKPPPGYQATVATTWEISFQRLQGKAPEATDLLNLCAFLAPDDIPRELLKLGAVNLPARLGEMLADPFRWDETLEAVRSYSLLDRVQDVLRIHRLVQMVLYDHLDTDARRSWSNVAIRLVDDAFPVNQEEVAGWPMSARLVPHALAAAGHAEALQVQAAMTSRLLTRVGLYLRTRAQYPEAREALEKSIEIAEAILPADNPELADILNDLGRVLHDLKEYELAKGAITRALESHEAAYGFDHPVVARDLNDLGSVLLSEGRATEAVERLRGALMIDESVHGADHPDVARDVGNLGRLSMRSAICGKERDLRRALQIDQASFRPDHPIVAADLSNLGLVLRDLGELVEAGRVSNAPSR